MRVLIALTVILYGLVLAGCASDKPAVDGGQRGSTEIVNSIGMKLRLIKPGSFMMGSESSDPFDGPVHRVKLTKGFYSAIHEVTQGEWERVMGSNPSKSKGTNLPVEQVSWNDAQEFCRKLSEMENVTYRLPTEAEWEYACRAGSTARFFWGEKFDASYAWKDPNSEEWPPSPWGSEYEDRRPHVVGGKRPNRWGLYDMTGNVWEWCQDWFSEYSSTDQIDPKGAADGSGRVCRGGSCRSNEEECCSALRVWAPPTQRRDDIGFRVVSEVR